MSIVSWVEVFRFECRHQLRSPLFAIVAGLFFALAFAATASESVRIGGVGPNLNLNAAYAIIITVYVFSLLSMFSGVAFVAAPVTRDTELKTAELLYATGLAERDYLIGRFLGGTLFAGLSVVAGLFGVMLGTLMPWLDPERIGAFSLAPYWFSLYAVILPNVFIICGLFFSLAALSRSMLAAYVGALAMMIFYVVVAANTDTETVAYTALADPFGLIAFGEITNYWTVFDRNERVPEVAGSFLYNRLIWMSLAAAALGLTGWRFRFSVAPRARKRRRKVDSPAPAIVSLAPVRPAASGASVVVRQFATQLRMDVRGVVRSVPFYVILAFGMMNVLGGFYGSISQIYGTPVMPVTRMMIDTVGSNYLFVAIIIVVFYAGELVQRERQSGLSGIVDALPFPSAIMAASKIMAMWLVVGLLLLIVMITAIVVQLLNGYFDVQPGLYVAALFGSLGWQIYLFCVLAVFLQVLIPNKFAGMFAMIVVFITLQVLPSLGLEHGLYLFSVPSAPLSDMNGFGHYVVPLVSFGVYWSLVAGLLIVAAHLLWIRGLVPAFRERLTIARQRVTRNVAGATAALVIGVLGAGGWIFYNTNVLNTYVTTDDREADQAAYESAYKPYELMPLPEIVDLQVEVEIYPEERRILSTGVGLLRNETDAELATFAVSVAPALTVDGLTVDGATPTEADRKLGFYQFRFDPPMPPGGQRNLRWRLDWQNRGFPNTGATNRVVANGTFVNSTEIMPIPGYDAGRELQDNNTRRDYDLPGVRRLADYDDPAWIGRQPLGLATRSGFRALVSTSEDQTAIAPGYLENEWVENGRRYFDYVMDEPIWPFVSFQSARYDVVRDRWGDVDLAVYYHPAHDFNVDVMIESSKKSLDYFTTEFSPFQYRQFRILEFPAYASFAQSYPNTIPFSEAIGFIADLRDDTNIDYVFYVTAHEMAHQWWGHQVIGANVQGVSMILETLSQYSALMVMEREYGPAKMRRFLKYELDRYLQSRGGELIEELPLRLVENQGYVHYRKGSLAMYALKDAIGEAAVNRALRRFVRKHAFKGPPFPRSGDLIAEFRAEAGDEHQDLITDLFEKIVLWDMQVEAATSTPLDDGRYKVEVTVAARQFEADGEGRETEIDLRGEFDLAVFPEAGDDLGESDLPEPLLLEKRTLRSGSQVFEFVVDQEPASVGVDPYNKFIDRNPTDNVKQV